MEKKTTTKTTLQACDITSLRSLHKVVVFNFLDISVLQETTHLLLTRHKVVFNFVHLSVLQETEHGVRAGSNERNLNFNGHHQGHHHGHHQGPQNDYDLDKYHGYDPVNQYGSDNQHNLNLNVLPIDPVTETTIR